jgi:two-component system, OmpR family, sensor histidine kinase BaeS
VRIQSKIFLAILGSSLLLVTSVMLLFQWSVSSGMLDYVNNRQVQRAHDVAEELSEFYNEAGSWQPLRDDPRLFRRIVLNALDSRDSHESPPKSPRLPRPPIPLALLDGDQYLVVGHSPPPPVKLIAIELHERKIGWLMVPQLREINSGFEQEFLRRQRSSLVLIGTALLAVAALIALPLARHLVKPIRQLTHGTHELTQGNYAVTLPAQRHDELGQLARDFNELAHTLAANDSSRKRWLADISHELRTPLSILRGELEAILDGVRPADNAHLQSLHQEIQHLNRLVDDLHALTTADIGGLQYRKSICDVAELWRDQCASHRKNLTAAGLTFAVQIPEQEIELYGDEDRLQQLLDNLLDNNRKYTAAGGRIEVNVNALPNGVELVVQDSAPGVPEAALPKLFDHLFRVEDSRNRATGGSGLGLAICQRIVAAHEGNISAMPSPLGGLLIRVFLPYR